MKLPKLRGTNSVTDQKTVPVITEQLEPKRYNRHERRTGRFVILNRTNGMFVQSFRKKDGTIVVRDVQLDAASTFMHKTIELVMSAILMEEPNLDLDYRNIYRVGKQLKTK